MSSNAIAAISIFGGVWLIGVIAYVYSWIKTRTKPFGLPDDELIRRAFGDKEKDEAISNDNNASV